MSNILLSDQLGLQVTHFQLPNFLFTHLPKMREAELKLYLCILSEAHRMSSPEVLMPAKKARELAGLSPNAFTRAKHSLEGRKLVRKVGASRYVLLDGQGQPLPKYRDQKALHAKRITEDPTDFFRPRYTGRTVFQLTRAEYRKYYEARLRQSLPHGEWASARCPFHQDEHPSFSVALDKGIWVCRSLGCKSNSIASTHKSVLEFEILLCGCEKREAVHRIAAACGATDVFYTARSLKEQDPEVSYNYRNEDGLIVFTIHRFPNKEFAASHSDETGKSIWTMKGVRCILFDLPSVIRAQAVIVVEGEKDAVCLSEFGLRDSAGEPVAVTTNPFGAGKWKDEYSAYLKGKDV